MERTRFRSVFFIIYTIITAVEANVTCTVDGMAYICKNVNNRNDVPHSLPANIWKVTLIGTDEMKGNLTTALFNNPSWKNVSELSILNFLGVTFVPRDFLDGLEHLQFLSISSCPELRHIDPDVFHNTLDLQALYLDENLRLEISSVEAALTGKLSKLKYLSLISIHARIEHIVLGVNFSKALQGKKLTYFDISRSNILSLQHDLGEQILTTVKYLNLSYSSLVLLGFPIIKFNPNHPLELLDVCGCRAFIENRGYNKYGNEKCHVPPKLKYMYLKDITDVRSGLKIKQQHHFQQCENKEFILLDLSNNDIIILNISISGNFCFHAFQMLDLNSNNMQYISPFSLHRFPSLKILDLSKNQLHKMQNTDDFVNMFSGNEDLEILFLRSNSLSVLPENMFSSNIKLRVLDLSDNELTDLNSDWHNMQDLTMIDLRNNRLKHLSTTFVEQLQKISLHQTTGNKQNTTMTNILLSQFLDKRILAEKYKYGYNADNKKELTETSAFVSPYLTIKLSENPLLCDCGTLDILQWILTTNISIVNRTTLLCNYGNHETVVNYKSFETVRQNCRLPVVIGTAIASSILIIFCLCTVIVIRRHKHKMASRYKDIRLLKRTIESGTQKFKFVVFLVYCSRDHDIVEENIRPSLNTYLKEKLNTDMDLVCTGHDSFVPGMRIIDEIHRCVDESLVVVPVITPPFLQSEWSQKECAVAIDKHKQVVLLIKQQTDTSTAITTIKHLIARYSRATWSINEGHIVIHPSWNTICQGVINIAADTLRNYRRQTIEQSNETLSLLETRV
ncbi:hypothetical protein CHS0354_032651 [Potamilus streckersoni]|uniref:TIR domain-containing protein n=1 Tax=Potamilus streckersoni TaxID=2493646 RepID=A0AAE0SF68_9BIVA|nr:hypothetical protein CHS0354_032651 [Potamilus streckersoni]